MYGQIGAGVVGSNVVLPVMIQGNHLDSITYLSCGYSYSLFVLKSGRVLACGDNSELQLGMSPTVAMCDLPTIIPRLEEIVMVAASHVTSAAINVHGDLFLFGGDVLENQTPVAPTFIDSVSVPMRSVSLGNGFGAAIDVQGALYTWGVNNCFG